MPERFTPLLDAARSGALPTGPVVLASGLVMDLQGYVLAWAGIWPTGDAGDRTHITRRLDEALIVWGQEKKMGVYVDRITDYKGSVGGAVGRVSQKWCHMTAESLDELHAMADRIGLRRAWFQPARLLRFCHYDLTPARRAAAIKAGAIEQTRDDLAARIDRENALPGGPPVAFPDMRANQ